MEKEHSEIAKIVWAKLTYTECQIDGDNTTVIEIKDVWKMIEEIESMVASKYNCH